MLNNKAYCTMLCYNKHKSSILVVFPIEIIELIMEHVVYLELFSCKVRTILNLALCSKQAYQIFLNIRRQISTHIPLKKIWQETHPKHWLSIDTSIQDDGVLSSIRESKWCKK